MDGLQSCRLLAECENLCRFATTLRTERRWSRRWRWLWSRLMPLCSRDSNRYLFIICIIMTLHHLTKLNNQLSQFGVFLATVASLTEGSSSVCCSW